jgi:NAD(P)-dependent dehydrogenase (short-subunit alcohol dehydrogenase family)
MAFAPLDLTGRVAVVIGGTTGIGRALVDGLVQAGAHVVASARREAEVEATARAVEAAGKRTLRVLCDVSTKASLQRLHDQVLEAFGQVDILINCAGRTKRTPSLEVSEDEFSGIMDTNLMGTLRACQVFARSMIERRYGRIINIASLSSFVALYEVAAYAASKAAVASLTKSLAIEWAKYGVNVNAIAPGVFRTALNQKLLDETQRGQEFKLRTPMGRFGKVEELAGAAVFLASEAASFVTGEIIVVDGGFLASGVNQ